MTIFYDIITYFQYNNILHNIYVKLHVKHFMHLKEFLVDCLFRFSITNNEHSWFYSNTN